MAVTKTVLKLTHQEAAFKITGAAGDTATIDLQTELIPMGGVNPGRGLITTTTSGTSVNGASTYFTADWVGAKIYTTAGVLVGTVATFNNGASLTLDANAAVALTDSLYYVSFYSQKVVGTQVANITGFSWTGAPTGVITITRGTNTVATLATEAASQFDFDGQVMPPDTTGSTADISVAFSGAAGELWIKIRKVSGWQTTVQPEQYGPYDDPGTLGASTTMSGSPDRSV